MLTLLPRGNAGSSQEVTSRFPIISLCNPAYMRNKHMTTLEK